MPQFEDSVYMFCWDSFPAPKNPIVKIECIYKKAKHQLLEAHDSMLTDKEFWVVELRPASIDQTFDQH